MKDLGPYTNLSRTFFGYSIGLEVIFLLFFVAVFSLSIFRTIKKIKDPKFNHLAKNEEDD